MTATAPFRFEIIKSYPQRGPLRQYRAAAATAFTCMRCRQAKRSKLVATVKADGSQLLCNGCYGYLLSAWNIKAGQDQDDQQSDALLRLLTSAVTEAEVERGRALLLARETLAGSLSPDSLTLLSTAEAVGSGLVSWHATDLDWSVATLPLCKAVEIELLRLVAQPLKRETQGLDLSTDATGELKAMVNYCRGHSSKPLTLGAIASFLKNVTSAKATAGPLAQSLRRVTRPWPRSDWLFDRQGLPAALDTLRGDFRNRAAHTEILDEEDFRACSELVIGPEGLLWRLLLSTRPR